MPLADLGIDSKILDRIPDGASIKIPHPGCSESPALKITNTVDGFTCHCFKCHEHVFSWHEDQSKRDRLLRQEHADALTKIKAEGSRELPADFSQSIAPRGLSWLGNGGWTLSLIAEYRVGWSESLGRVVFPLYDNNCYQGFTARAVFDKQSPKYWTNAPSDSVWYSGQAADSLVITEDILSAGRVGKVTPAASMLGTSIKQATLLRMVRGLSSVCVWLDDDNAGHHAAAKIDSILRWLPVEVHNLCTERDPKHLTTREIRECIQSIRFCSNS